MPKLVLPSSKYKASFTKDFLPHMGKSRVKYESIQKYINRKILLKDFAGFVKYIRSQEKSQNLPKGYVPQTVYWLVEGQKMLGWLSFRHYLNKNLRRIGGHVGYEVTPKYRGNGHGNLILKLALKKARVKGLKKIFITCDEDNLFSKKVIEHNGGQAIQKIWLKDKKVYKLRYWITI